MPGEASRGGGSSCKIAAIVPREDLRAKARCPLSNSYRTTPNAKISERASAVSPRLVGRHVGSGSHHAASSGEGHRLGDVGIGRDDFRYIRHSCKAEIEQLNGGRQKDVPWIQVAVNDALRCAASRAWASCKAYFNTSLGRQRSFDFRAFGSDVVEHADVEMIQRQAGRLLHGGQVKILG